MRAFSFYFLHSYVGDFICFTAFRGRDVCDVGDFICLAGEREGNMQYPGKRLPLNAGKLTALNMPKSKMAKMCLVYIDL